MCYYSISINFSPKGLKKYKRCKKVNQKILVTGGAGFIGSHLTDELLRRGYFVRVLDNLQSGSLYNLMEASASRNFEFMQGDILSPEDCAKAMKDIDIVYHLACLNIRSSIRSPLENHRVNAEGTMHVLEAALRNNVKKVFYISSSEVYGDAEEFPISEKTVPHPSTVYGASKLAGEHYARAYFRCEDLDVTIVRLFNNYGPRAYYEADKGEMIPRTIVNAILGKQPVVFGDGNQTRDFFYVKDAARALSDLISIPELKGSVLNIGDGKEISMKTLAEKILQVMGLENLGTLQLDERPADLKRLWVDASKFYRLTGFKQNYSFDEGLLETINYYKNLKDQKGYSFSDIPHKNWETKLV